MKQVCLFFLFLVLTAGVAFAQSTPFDDDRVGIHPGPSGPTNPQTFADFENPERIFIAEGVNKAGTHSPRRFYIKDTSGPDAGHYDLTPTRDCPPGLSNSRGCLKLVNLVGSYASYSAVKYFSMWMLSDNRGQNYWEESRRANRHWFYIHAHRDLSQDGNPLEGPRDSRQDITIGTYEKQRTPSNDARGIPNAIRRGHESSNMHHYQQMRFNGYDQWSLISTNPFATNMRGDSTTPGFHGSIDHGNISRERTRTYVQINCGIRAVYDRKLKVPVPSANPSLPFPPENPPGVVNFPHPDREGEMLAIRWRDYGPLATIEVKDPRDPSRDIEVQGIKYHLPEPKSCPPTGVEFEGRTIPPTYFDQFTWDYVNPKMAVSAPVHRVHLTPGQNGSARFQIWNTANRPRTFLAAGSARNSGAHTWFTDVRISADRFTIPAGGGYTLAVNFKMGTERRPARGGGDLEHGDKAIYHFSVYEDPETVPDPRPYMWMERRNYGNARYDLAGLGVTIKAFAHVEGPRPQIGQPPRVTDFGLDTTYPNDAISNANTGGTWADLSWTSPAANDAERDISNDMNITSYEIRFGLQRPANMNALTEQEWDAMVPVEGPPPVYSGGIEQEYSLRGLPTSSTIYAAIRGINSYGRRGPASVTMFETQARDIDRGAACPCGTDTGDNWPPSSPNNLRVTR